MGIIIVSLVGERFSWDALLISVSIIVAACIIGSAIKEQMETRKNGKDENDNKLN